METVELGSVPSPSVRGHWGPEALCMADTLPFLIYIYYEAVMLALQRGLRH